jgi:hypothetical protein
LLIDLLKGLTYLFKTSPLRISAKSLYPVIYTISEVSAEAEIIFFQSFPRRVKTKSSFSHINLVPVLAVRSEEKGNNRKKETE